MKRTTARRIRMFTAMLMLVTTLFALAADIAAAGYSIVSIPEGDYYICAYDNNSYCIDVTGGSTAVGTYVQLYKRSDGNNAQIYTLTHVGNNWYTITNRHSGLVLNVKGGENAAGARLWMYENDGTAACHFRFRKFDNSGNYIIEARVGDKVVDLDNNVIANTTKVHLWNYHEGASARWNLLPVSASSASAGVSIENGGVYTIGFKNTSMGLNVQYAPTSGIGNIVLDNISNPEGNEKWIFTYNAKYDAYFIEAYYRRGTALNALYGASASKGSQVRLHPSDINDTASLWKVETCGSCIRLKNVACGYYVDIAYGGTSAGTRANLWSSDQANQQFILKKVDSTSAAPNMSDKLLFPLKGDIIRSSSLTTDNQYCDYRTGGAVGLYAPANGTVTFIQKYDADNGKLKSYGNYIRFTSDPINGATYTVLMAHLSSFVGYPTKITESNTYPCSGFGLRDESDPIRVSQGQLIGYTGMTGNASAHHLHLEIKKNGTAVSPASVCTVWN